jgi:hypothetical protein
VRGFSAENSCMQTLCSLTRARFLRREFLHADPLLSNSCAVSPRRILACRLAALELLRRFFAELSLVRRVSEENSCMQTLCFPRTTEPNPTISQRFCRWDSEQSNGHHFNQFQPHQRTHTQHHNPHQRTHNTPHTHTPMLTFSHHNWCNRGGCPRSK